MNSFNIAIIIFFIITIVKCKDNNNPDKVLCYKLTLIKPNSKENFIQFNSILTQLDFKIPTIELCLGTPPQCFPFSLSFKIPFIYVLSYRYYSKLLKFFDKKFSVSFMGSGITKEFPYQSIPITSQLVYDFVSDSEKDGITSKLSYRCPFYMINEEKDILLPGDIAGGLGLMANKIDHNKPLKENETLISYVYHLFLNRFIDYNSFTIRYNDIDGGNIQFGRKKNNDDRDIQYCISKNSINEWGCSFHQIRIGFASYDTNEDFAFDPSFPLIAGPSTTVLHLFEVFLSKTENQCGITKQNDIDVLSCSLQVDVRNLPDIAFVYSYYHFRLRMENMFVFQEITGEMKQICLIVGHLVQTWRLGLPAFKNQLLVFDQEQRKIGFYSEEHSNSETENYNNNNTEMIDNKHNGSYYILAIMSMIIISGIAILSWSKIRLIK